MSIRNGPDSEPIPLVGDGPDDIVGMPAHREYEINKTADKKCIIYPTHHGVKNHVPLIMSSKTDIINAVLESDPATLADLLETSSKEKIDHQDLVGFTALHYSCMMSTTGVNYGRKDPDRIACCELLIQAGANLDIPGQWGQTAIQLACISLYPAVECTSMLVNAKANIMQQDEFGGTPLHSCAGMTKTLQLKELMKHPDYEKAKAIKNKEGKTATEIAVEVYEKQEKKVELAPYHCEVRMLFETGKGLPGAPNAEELATLAKKGGKPKKKKA
mmetsp:Transcript_39843/g.105253  ORF Transcript_39843/g.105253 Transcript_39843/m.105253 type:complete len:273 (-) Transcript_39843:384-1202(-)